MSLQLRRREDAGSARKATMARIIKESKLRKYKDKAAALVEKGKYARALPLYRDILEAFPTDTAVMLKIGDLCRRLEMRDEAVAVYSNAARHHANAGSLLQAIAICKLILEIDPDHRSTQEKLAELYTEKYGTATPAVPGAAVSPPAAPFVEPEMAGMTIPPEEIAVEVPPVVVDFTGTFEDEPVDEVGDDVEDDDDVVELGEDMIVADDVHPDEMVVVMAPPPPPAARMPQIPLFSSLDPESFMDLINRLPVRDFGPLETVVKEGESGSSFFIIASGSVEVFKGEDSVAVLEEGAFFGEMAMIMPGPRQASVVTVEPCRLFEISNTQLDELRSLHPQVGRSLMEFAEKRLLNNLMLTSPLFVPFSEEDRQSLITVFKPYLFEAGAVVIEQGTKPTGMYLLVTGTVDVTSRDDRGEVLHVDTLHAGDIFGETALLTRQPSLSTVTTRDSCRMLALPRERFNELIMTHPQILELLAGISDERSEALKKLKQRPVASGEGGGTALL